MLVLLIYGRKCCFPLHSSRNRAQVPPDLSLKSPFSQTPYLCRHLKDVAFRHDGNDCVEEAYCLAGKLKLWKGCTLHALGP